MLKQYIKNIVNNLPPQIGVLASRLPFEYRLGNQYLTHKNNILKGESVDFEKIKNIVEYAQKNIIFYKEYYRSHHFHYLDLNSLVDIKNIPVITKKVLQDYGLMDRCSPHLKGISSNTGGTSGQPLDFKLDMDCYAREWAHMHAIWSSLGYKLSSIKLTFRGKNFGSTPIKYFFNQNEFQVNAYSDFDDVVNSLTTLIDKYKIEYLHGYPSSIFDFLTKLDEIDPLLLSRFRRNLKGVFLSSEYPAPHYRKAIDRLSTVPSVSWYGHSEMTVLAYERTEQYLYEPFQQYGVAESVEIDGLMHLVGTSIHNLVCPLIRYDTGDIIEPISIEDGILKSFKISDGRVGEFIFDSMGRRISLTGLIFGRHHKIFSIAKFIQVFQSRQGVVDIFVVADISIDDIPSMFDFSCVNLLVYFHKRVGPKKTNIGKVPLLLKEFYEASNSNP